MFRYVNTVFPGAAAPAHRSVEDRLGIGRQQAATLPPQGTRRPALPRRPPRHRGDPPGRGPRPDRRAAAAPACPHGHQPARHPARLGRRHGRGSRVPAEHRPHRAALWRRTPLQLRHLRLPGTGPRLRRQRLRRDASGSVRMGCPAAGDVARDLPPREGRCRAGRGPGTPRASLACGACRPRRRVAERHRRGTIPRQAPSWRRWTWLARPLRSKESLIQSANEHRFLR